ncbi:MAG: hypothetical protein LBF60_03245 [Treponema sp.]|nr:hypothetical protein [Treponema sp.]
MKELQYIHSSLPFTMIELHSDNGGNGGEFINHDILNWREITETLCLTGGRPRHSNDNCYAEQKNNAFVKNYAGYARFDSEPELAALPEARKYLCPLLNFFIPHKKLLSKTHAGSKTVKVYDTPKTPRRRHRDAPRLYCAKRSNMVWWRRIRGGAMPKSGGVAAPRSIGWEKRLLKKFSRPTLLTDLLANGC